MKSRKSSTVEKCKVQGKAGEPWHWVTDYFVKWKGYGPESNSWVQEDDMDAEELIDEYLAKHVDVVNLKGNNWSWQSYTDPFTKKKVWYIQEDTDWDWLGGA